MRLMKPQGDNLKKKASKNLTLGVVCLFAFLVLFVTSIDFLPSYINFDRYSTVRGIAIGMFLVGWYDYLILKYPRYRRGLIGEQKVSETLMGALGNEYSLFNDVMLKGKRGNIDHIVVGPTGIFAIETKNPKGKIISYYGDNWEGVGKKSPSRQARINAVRIKRILASQVESNSKRFWVQGIVAIANNEAKLTPKKPPESVEVERINELANHIKNKPKRFETREIEQIETELKNSIQAEK
jgi:hypothetical protein